MCLSGHDASSPLPQFCINFANEKLQQFFLKFVFKAEEDLYSEEGVRWTRIEYQDNQGCIDLIEKIPTGILRILDETCKKPASAASGSDEGFCTAVAETHRRNDFVMDPRGAGYKKWLSSQAFAVRHFAGDVCYFGEGFCEKNNDTLHTDFTDQAQGPLCPYPVPPAAHHCLPCTPSLPSSPDVGRSTPHPVPPLQDDDWR